MEHVLTSVKKYRFFILIIFFLVVLSGCGSELTPIDSSSIGIFDKYFVYPFSILIKKLANFFHGSYGLSIVVITLGIRLVLLPFMYKQMKHGQVTQEKMKLIKPEMDLIREKYKNKNSMEDQLQLQQELSRLYKEHNFSPLSMASGCLPMIIQMPFLIAFYYAIRRTPEISEQSFLWFSLGETDLLLVIIAVVIYYIQAKVSMVGLAKEQQKQMAMMIWISPLMIGVISLNVPAALPLYWTVSGIFIFVQTFIIRKYFIKRIDS